MKTQLPTWLTAVIVALVGFIENQTGDTMERIYDVDTSDTSIRFECEVGVPTFTPKPLQLPVK